MTAARRAVAHASPEMTVDDITDVVIEESDRWWGEQGEPYEHAQNRSVIRGMVQDISEAMAGAGQAGAR